MKQSVGSPASAGFGPRRGFSCQLPDHRHGFTLIELLVVISIIAILLGILLPTFAGMRNAGIRTQCRSNLRGMGVAIKAYHDANEARLPLARYMPEPFPSSFDDPTLPDVLRPYVSETSRMYECPGDNVVFSKTGISYTYNAGLAGRTLDQNVFARRFGFNISEIPVSYDMDGNTFVTTDGPLTAPFFHATRNLLFADGHVGDFQN